MLKVILTAIVTVNLSVINGFYLQNKLQSELSPAPVVQTVDRIQRTPQQELAWENYKEGLSDSIREHVDHLQHKYSTTNQFAKEYCQEDFIEGIKRWEGFKSHLYRCSGGKVTIGYGFTGKEIGDRTYISKQEADRLLRNDVLPIYEQYVDEIVEVHLNQGQRLALVSFCYNLGPSGLRQLVGTRDGNRLNGGNYKSVERLLPLYRRAGGKRKEGLIKRRAWELKLWKNESQANELLYN